MTFSESCRDDASSGNWLLFFTPKHLSNEHLSTFQRIVPFLRTASTNLTLVVASLGEITGEVPDYGAVQRVRVCMRSA